jgi:hypothetical protein
MTALIRAWPFLACQPMNSPSAFGSCNPLLMFNLLLTSTNLSVYPNINAKYQGKNSTGPTEIPFKWAGHF